MWELLLLLSFWMCSLWVYILNDSALNHMVLVLYGFTTFTLLFTPFLLTLTSTWWHIWPLNLIYQFELNWVIEDRWIKSNSQIFASNYETEICLPEIGCTFHDGETVKNIFLKSYGDGHRWQFVFCERVSRGFSLIYNGSCSGWPFYERAWRACNMNEKLNKKEKMKNSKMDYSKYKP